MAVEIKIAADGPTKEFTATNSFSVVLDGTFGGGTVTLQERLDDGTFHDVTLSPKAAPDDYIADNFGVNIYRFNASGTTSPDITIALKGNIRNNRANL
jgi:hypothetical protein